MCKALLQNAGQRSYYVQWQDIARHWQRGFAFVFTKLTIISYLEYIFESQYLCETRCQMLDKNNMT